MNRHVSNPFAAPAASAICVLASIVLHAPATALTTRGDFDRPPFYHGKAPASVRHAAHVAVSFRDEPGSLDPTPDNSPALAALLDSLRTEINRLGLTRPLAGDWPMSDAPKIRFGARREGEGPPPAPGDAEPKESRRMTFAIEGPGRAWRERVRAGAGDSIDVVVVIQLGFSEQWVRQTSWKGSKSIELGTHRSMPLEWLTSLDDPVQVLQLTGALVTKDGKIARVGSEGVIARRTGLAASALGAQETLREREIAEVLMTPAWREALSDLIEGLLRPAKR